MSPPLLTVGHGTAERSELADLFRSAGVACVVDVRRFPGSRRHPHTRRDELARWLPEVGIAYRWDERLGGRRRPQRRSPDTWWRVEAFRAYAAHMRSPDFLAAADELLAQAARCVTAVMCSESLWWRCHRRLVSDFAVLARGVPVQHLGHDGGLTEHPVAAGACLRDGLLFYGGPDDRIRSPDHG
jgi:uncharacterized protein (DUF488 family)